MDEFGVLVESIGFKTQGKSVPMADLKSRTNINSGFSRTKSAYNSNSINGTFVDDLDGIFRSDTCQKTQSFASSGVYDDMFGGPISNSKPPESRHGGKNGAMFDLDSIFKGSNNSSKQSTVSGLYDNGDDIFGGMPGLKSSGSANHYAVFGSGASPPRQNGSVDDLFRDFGRMGFKSNDSDKVEHNSSESDDLIPGFGGSSASSIGKKRDTSRSSYSQGHSSKSNSTLAEDPFVVLKSSSYKATTFNPLEQDAQKGAGVSSIDELEDFAMGMKHSDANGQSDLLGEMMGASIVGNDLESFFSMSSQAGSGQRQRSTTEDPLFDTLFQERGASKVEKTYFETSSSTEKASPARNFVDDFSSLFGEAAPSSVEFQEIEGESEERRRARLNHHMRTQARMAKALKEKNQRDFQTQQEQEERHRVAETLDADIKRWAAGKEGNLRALLSSLQHVLWPECGWQPVSLTDLITSVSVKKVYYKATLCVHPDKVQQKGADIREKYIAEKVFDLLKEAWNKFNSEELR